MPCSATLARFASTVPRLISATVSSPACSRCHLPMSGSRAVAWAAAGIAGDQQDRLAPGAEGVEGHRLAEEAGQTEGRGGRTDRQAEHLRPGPAAPRRSRLRGIRRTSLDRLFQGIQPDQKAAVLREQVDQQPALDRRDDEQQTRREPVPTVSAVERSSSQPTRLVPASSQPNPTNRAATNGEHTVADQGRPCLPAQSGSGQSNGNRACAPSRGCRRCRR